MPARLPLITKVDTFELVRDQLGAILLLEVANQQTLAVAAGQDPQAYAVRIYSERSNPWSEFLDLPETDENPTEATPLVNITFDSLTFDQAASNVVERQKGTANFHVDVYAYAAASATVGGHKPGDEQAAYEVHRVVRLVRNILMSGAYTYLGMRGTVWKRWISSIDVFQPPSETPLAQQVAAARINLQVDFSEFSPQFAGEPLELLSVGVKRAETGELYFTGTLEGEPET